MKRWSLLSRLTFGYGLSFVLLMLASHLFLYYLLVQSGESDRNSVLSDRMSAITSLLKSPARGKEELIHRLTEEWPTRGGEKVELRILASDGEALETKDFPAEFKDEMQRLKNRGDISEQKFHIEGKDRKQRLAKFEVSENSLGMKNPILIFGLIGADQSRSFLDQYKRVAILILIVSTLLSLFIGLQIAKRGLLPMIVMTKELSNIRSRTLHERMTIDELPIELQKLARAFNQTLDSLEDAFDRLTRFSSDIAHELRTPLANILGEIEVALSKPRSNENYVEIMSSTLEECNRLKQIIESLLFLARAENIKSELKVESRELNSEIISILEFFEPAADEAGITLKFNRPQESYFVNVEKTLFQRALGNLISNAIHYTPAGKEILISVSAADSQFVAIRVSDQGIGIAVEHLTKIFDRFYRVDANRNWTTGGVGLGLSIVKSIVELHKGHVEMKSELGVGTQVMTTWPRA